MLEFRKLNGAVEARDHFKNGSSLKNTKFFSIIVMTALFAVTTTEVFSQVKGKFRCGLDLGWGCIFPVSQGSSGWSAIPTIDANFGYNLHKNMTAGFRAGWTPIMNFRSAYGIEYRASNFNFTGTYTYFFGQRTKLVTPFIGGGFGLYVMDERFILYNYNLYDQGNRYKFGGFLTTGLEIGKFRFSVECELIPAKKIITYEGYYDPPYEDYLRTNTLKLRNSYWTFNVGFYVGGGNRKKASAVLAAEQEIEGEKEEKRRKAHSFSVFAANYVESRIRAWQEKGEFERTEEWHNRVNEHSRAVKAAELNREAEQAYIAEQSLKMPFGSITLGSYDADREEFLIRNSVHGDWFERVPFAEAENFKNNWSNIIKMPKYVIRNDFIAFAGYEFSPIGATKNNTTEQKENQAIAKRATETKQDEKVEQECKEIAEEKEKVAQERETTTQEQKQSEQEVINTFATNTYDVILLKDGQEIKAIVTEITPSEIKYKAFENPNGPTRTLAKNSVFVINYANGTREVVGAVSAGGGNFNRQNVTDCVKKTAFGLDIGIGGNARYNQFDPALGIRLMHQPSPYFGIDFLKINWLTNVFDNNVWAMNLQFMSGIRGNSPTFFKCMSVYSAFRLGYGMLVSSSLENFLTDYKGLCLETEFGINLTPTVFAGFVYNHHLHFGLSLKNHTFAFRLGFNFGK